MIKQLFNSQTGGQSLAVIDLSGENGTLYTAQVTGTTGQSVLIQGSNFGAVGSTGIVYGSIAAVPASAAINTATAQNITLNVVHSNTGDTITLESYRIDLIA